MQNCWEILNCGRQAGGRKVDELGECIASRQKMGHSCWAVAGTLCGGEVQGSVRDKHSNCLVCEVYKTYNRFTGNEGRLVAARYADEEARHQEFLRRR